MPRRRAGHTTAVTIGGEQFHITANADSDGTLGEVFINWSKHGSAAAGLIDGYATALSIGLRYRVPLPDLIRHGLNLRFAPAGHTDDPDIPRAASIADYVVRRLAIDWLPYVERAGLGIYTLAERVHQAPAWLAGVHCQSTARQAPRAGFGPGSYAATQN